MDSLKQCEIEDVRKAIFKEIVVMQEECKRIESQIIIEKAQNVDITEKQIKFFLNQMRKGDINDIKYKKLLIDVLIDKVYVYDDHITIIFNVKEKESIDIKMPNIDEIESSFLGTSGSP